MDAAELSNDSSLITLWSVTGRGCEVRCVIETSGGNPSESVLRGTARMLIDGVTAEFRKFVGIDDLMALTGDWHLRLTPLVGEWQ